jgi:cobalt-zinc-cadmium efflux system outer membrane protein
MVKFLKIGRLAAFALIVLSVLSNLAGAPLFLTKAQAVAQALRSNGSLMAARAMIDRAQGHWVQAGRWENPELSLAYATDQSFNNEGESKFAVGFEQRFPVTNQLRMQKGIAQDELELALAEVANQERLLTQAVEAAVANVSELQAQLKLRAEIARLNQKFADFIESRIETGEASVVDANQMKIEIYAVEQAMQQFENKLAGQLSELRQLIGADVDAEIVTAFEFDLPASPPELNFLSLEALENHPEFRMKALLCRIADKQVSLAKAARWADIAVRIFYEEGRSVDAPDGLGRDRSVGLGVSIPLPLMNRNQGAIAANRAQQRRFAYELSYTGSKIRNEARVQRELVLSLYVQVSGYETSLTQLVEENLANMNAAYSAGQIGLTELFRSQEQALKIQSAHLAMLHDYEQAMIDWKAATAWRKQQTL